MVPDMGHGLVAMASQVHVVAVVVVNVHQGMEIAKVATKGYVAMEAVVVKKVAMLMETAA
jgi:glucosamine 6-phosphate synthetase-like amidotransferase/phosphosugar isomerase protein